MSTKIRRFLFGVLTLFVLSTVTLSGAIADVRLPGFFNDHMVFQRDAKIKVWGWAEPGETVKVSLGEDSANATANSVGAWSVELPAREASKEPATLSVQGTNTITINDILIGEVWLCSGQSNMEWSVRQSANADAEIAAADHPLIRHVKMPRRPSNTAIDDLQANWQVCSPETVAGFTACGYFMARHLQQELDVPIGLINSSWGGTRIEPWTTPVGFERVEALGEIYQSVLNRTPGTEQYQERVLKHIADTEAWLDAAKVAIAANSVIQPSPQFPAESTPFGSHQDPTMLYNGMIHGLVGYPIRGAIWYQGESNRADGMMYYEKKKALINGWREIWGQGDFPFYIVQIGPFQYGNEDPEILARFWEAQAATQQLPNTGMVVINDIATTNDIHPPNKQDVGLRLARLALKYDYGYDDIVADSPEMASFEIQNDSIKITFERTGGGLKTRDGEPATHFEVIGPGSDTFEPAQAAIDGDTITLSSDAVKDPVAFRFAWHKLAEPNLVGESGLPVGAFRGGEVPEIVDITPGD